MIKIENVEVVGWEHAIRGMRNAKNSWDKSDSNWRYLYEEGVVEGECIGSNDLKLMKSLVKAGDDHGKVARYLDVYLDITAPLYFWKEFRTYRKGRTFIDPGEDFTDFDDLDIHIETNSCSTMHTITEKEFTLEDFSCEHLMNEDDSELTIGDVVPHTTLECVVMALNFYRNKYLEAQKKPMKEESKRAGLVKKYWWQIIQLLPSSYNQRRTVKLNYQTLRRMYHARKHHKLDEWRAFCGWIESLPYSELITGKENK